MIFLELNKITVSPIKESSKSIYWHPPGDKSISQRATFLASLAEGTSRISDILWSEDTVNNLIALKKLGVGIEIDNNDVLVTGVGKFGYRASNNTVYLGNSATSSRIMISLLSAQKGRFKVDGNKMLRNRPMEWVVEPLKDMGAQIEWLNNYGCLPVGITGSRLDGMHHRIKVSSAQAVSALLYAALLADKKTRIYKKTKARDHTERIFKYFDLDLIDTGDYLELTPPEKILPHDIFVPGDISSAAFLIGLVAMQKSSGLELTVKKVNLNPTRTGFLEILQRMGADLTIINQGELCGEPIGEVIIRSGSELSGVKVSGDVFVQSMIDEIPILAAVAATAKGETVITDAFELANKDTNRIITTIELLNNFGIEAYPIEGGLVVTPGEFTSPGNLEVPNDHRISMVAMIIASFCNKKTEIYNWDTVRVSFPGFLEAFNLIGLASTDDDSSSLGPSIYMEMVE
ncbi:3-phosphoshikimate 1-carboxyvinyltransferase [Lysinibacillus mangiferihumi]|uniref:3-phosphoshikimate 1-carboxyvinyltransferase n=1 Tax=Lysinibacillus mangiferihumi TaxID=1130819 RepID=A0A4V5TJL5_9BACI|nr:3-phosphoshikimate 1-carboxyvinyltransferase [Lysinibacillus mangiferihumi]TKI60063.1 3-phosphoshikimate 1-carboxyvinyltransferase [Lysinibacillus mangiferihumi]